MDDLAQEQVAHAPDRFASTPLEELLSDRTYGSSCPSMSAAAMFSLTIRTRARSASSSHRANQADDLRAGRSHLQHFVGAFEASLWGRHQDGGVGVTNLRHLAHGSIPRSYPVAEAQGPRARVSPLLNKTKAGDGSFGRKKKRALDSRRRG